ncbi:hypothetical protein AKJ16_DCAP15727 [Drosera capensis]
MLLGGLFFELGELKRSGIVLFEGQDGKKLQELVVVTRIWWLAPQPPISFSFPLCSIGMHEEGGISLSLMQSCTDPSPTIIVQARTAQIITSSLSKDDDVLAICDNFILQDSTYLVNPRTRPVAIHELAGKQWNKRILLCACHAV